jgi:nitrogen fixation/metabolism regulation signal transduction histidine kinase
VRDHTGQLARLAVLGAAFGVGLLLDRVVGGHPYFLFLVLGGALLLCVSIVVGPSSPHRSVRYAVLLLDVAWIMLAIYLADGLASFLLPLLYVVVATATVRGGRWEKGATLAGALTGVFALGTATLTGADLALATAQIALLAASVLAVQLVAQSHQPVAAETDLATRALYDTLLQTTPEAVVNVDPEDWRISYHSPAADALFDADGTRGGLVGLALDDLISFGDKAFLKTCRRRLDEDDFVRGAVTAATTMDGRELQLCVNLTPSRPGGDGGYVQAVLSPTDAAAEGQSAFAVYPGYEFAAHYIPSLTHELNNHLAIIRLSAEMAATTGRLPDFGMIQSQVDHCQDVLQTVVGQVMRATMASQVAVGTPTCNLQQALEHALLLVRPQVLSSGTQLQVALPEAPLPTVVGHPYELQEVLVRTILSATRAMCEQDPPRTLSLQAAVHDGKVELTVADLGPGLPWRELAAANGYMMALCGKDERRGWCVVREGVTRFGGTLVASNGLNGGARVRITLLIAEN